MATNCHTCPRAGGRGPLFSGSWPRAAWHGRSDPARRARGITPGTSLAIAPGADACALVGAAVTCHGALRALARGTQETRVVGCWKCWCLFCTSNCRNADSSRIGPPPSLRLGPPWPLSLPNSRMSASECSERCTPASPAAVGAKEQRRRHDSEADEDG